MALSFNLFAFDMFLPMDTNFSKQQFMQPLKFYRLSPWYCSYYMAPLLLLPLTTFSRFWYELCILLVSAAVGLFLASFWSHKIYLFECFTKVRDLSNLVDNPESLYVHYNGSICKVFTEIYRKEGRKLFFTYANKKYIIESLKENIVKEIKPQWNYTLNELAQGNYKQKYEHNFDKNILRFPRKSFASLFKEQITSPLFCFSVFSSVLSLFNDYVLNSLFSIGVSFAVEAAMTVNRLVTLQMFQNYEVIEQDVVVIRDNKERTIHSTEIKPGDIIKPGEQGKLCCDMLILEGSGVVNEAMLSGESIPLLKNSIHNSKTDEFFDDNRHKKHMLFSGTEILKQNKQMKCLVLHTGFDTEKGNLLNRMLTSEEIKYDKEALKFVIALSAISVVASVLMFFYSAKSGYPLFLDIIILFTNSIPFELPLEMGTSVQMAVRALCTKGIFTLEPYRIQMAGKLNVCCFDKTGTLTEAKLNLVQITKRELSATDKVLLSSCNDLQLIDGKYEGDPLDMALFEYLNKNKLFDGDFRKMHEIPFTSESRRQSVVIESNGRKYFVSKGAPETIAKYLKKQPDDYANYEKYAKEGMRVIAVAYKDITKLGNGLITNLTSSLTKLSKQAKTKQSTQVEPEPLSTKELSNLKSLNFCCFLLFGTKIKDYAVEMVSQLQNSNHRVVMITGDNKLTAENIAHQLRIRGRVAEGTEIGDVLAGCDMEKYAVFARADPADKEQIIEWYRKAGQTTMMVGDGTNDVGALKAADVGVAMLSGDFTATLPSGQNQLAPGSLGESIKPGDASVAAPFTVKSNNLKPILEIILQGRTSACTTIQMYKILALNSLISAFTIGILDLFEIKFSEKQMLALGVLNSLAFNAISRGKTLESICKRRVTDSIFSTGLICSVVLQGILHTLCFVALIWIFKNDPLILRYFSRADYNTEKVKFQPGELNTAIFALGMVQTIATFSFNYIGRPFREDIYENPVLFISLICMLGIPVNIIMNINSDLNEWLQCVDIGTYKNKVIFLSFTMILITYLIDLLCKDKMMESKKREKMKKE